MKSVSAVKATEQPSAEPVFENLAMLNETFDRFKGDITLHGTTFHNVLHALEGIQAINRVILANTVSKQSFEDVVLEPMIIGGFHAAVVALTNFSIGALDEEIERNETCGAKS
ncbi:hypothetical protein AWB64_00458 [Caballeronia sordidicola]|uniref:Uncharacterized protein n=1 Tax=Caballeronia sordidicola TaxID=196367 RepID=A0A158EWP5_CABSO|nr:hypothetical protein [Caballeronia sordidicola]SAL11956.1 hypothetical protein AWB64_00458 [Caballeronia sordidicola]